LSKPKVKPKRNIRVLKATDDPIVVLLRHRDEARQMAEKSHDWDCKVPYRMEIHRTHIILDTMEQGRHYPWEAKPRVRTFWFTDIIQLNETMKRIHEGSFCEDSISPHDSPKVNASPKHGGSTHGRTHRTER